MEPKACACGSAGTSAQESQPAESPPDGYTLQTTFAIPKMDCAAEEALVRIALDGVEGIGALNFDLTNHRLVVSHTGDANAIQERLAPLSFGARMVSTTQSSTPAAVATSRDESRTLWTLLAINAVMFVAELTAGLVAQSTGLIADSLDMFADAAVYGLSLYAVGRAAALKRRAAHLSGWIQIALALCALLEVARRFLFGSDPEPPLMIVVASIALLANVACLMLISRHRHGGAHMKASWIFSSNDVLANAGVIAAGILVAWTNSSIPDLVIGAIIAAVVLTGGVRILRLRS
jgi:cation transport ATPase